MSTLALLFTLSFVLLTIFLSIWQKVGLEKEIFIGTVRAAVQLIAVGYVLHFIFSAESYAFIMLMIVVMVPVATINSANKWRELQGIYWRIGLAITVTEVLSMSMMIGLEIIEPTAQYIIPISGMIIGNSMIVSGLFLNRLKTEIETRMDEIKVYLALGASSKQAIKGIQKNTVKASMIPMIDGMKTVGLVQLPGMMTGMIIAGANPIEAVRYQLLIMYSLTSAAAITSIILSVFIHSLLFNESHQLIFDFNRIKK